MMASVLLYYYGIDSKTKLLHSAAYISDIYLEYVSRACENLGVPTSSKDDTLVPDEEHPLYGQPSFIGKDDPEYAQKAEYDKLFD